MFFTCRSELSAMTKDKSSYRWQCEQICSWMYRLCYCLMWQLIWNVSNLRALRHIIFLLSQSFNLCKSLLNTSRIYSLGHTMNSTVNQVWYSRETSRRLMWKDATREEAKALGDIKPLDGRMITENGVMKKERWAGWGRRVEWRVERRRERQRRLHLSAKTSPIYSTSQHTSEPWLLDWTDGVYLRKCVCSLP